MSGGNQQQSPKGTSSGGGPASPARSSSGPAHVESRSVKDGVALAATLAFCSYFFLSFKASIVSFVTRAFTETGPEHVSVSKTDLIIPMENHVILALWLAVLFTAAGMLLDFCLPVPLDMRKKKGDQQIYIQKILRGVIGIIIMVLEVYEVFYLGRLNVDIVWAKTPLAEFLNAFCGGFFIYEMIGLCSVYLSTNRIEGPLLLHHILGVSGCFCYMKARCSFFFVCTIMIEEISAPFTFLVWMDDKRNLSHTLPAYVKQIMLALVWIILRCGVDVYLWYHAIMNWNHIMSASGWWLYHFGFGFAVLTFYLNPYWLKMKLRYPIRNFKLRREGIVPKQGDISQEKQGHAICMFNSRVHRINQCHSINSPLKV